MFLTSEEDRLTTQIASIVLGELALIGLVVIVAVTVRLYQRERARLEMQES